MSSCFVVVVVVVVVVVFVLVCLCLQHNTPISHNYGYGMHNLYYILDLQEKLWSIFFSESIRHTC